MKILESETNQTLMMESYDKIEEKVNHMLINEVLDETWNKLDVIICENVWSYLYVTIEIENKLLKY
jgi:chemotaxis methyl-accepting protein methylase